MEKQTLQFVDTNRIEVELNGELRTIVLGMRTMKRVANALGSNKPEELTSLDGFMTIVFEGLRDKPDGLTIENLIDWIDDAKQEDQKRLKEFVMEQLGFMMKEYLDGIQAITTLMNNKADENEKANQNENPQQ